MPYQKPRNTFAKSQANREKILKQIQDVIDDNQRKAARKHNESVKLQKRNTKALLELANQRKLIDLETEKRLANIAKQYKQEIEL